MARKLRVQYSGAIYHLINRGDRKEAIFKGDADRHLFLDTLGEACEKTAWQVVAYCLMRNHFHLVIETPRPNLVAGMKWLLGTYTSRFNRRHKLTGHLFAGRYKALIVDGSGNGYLRTISEYVHLNPVRAGLILPSQKVATYRWSSYPLYLSKPAQRPVWLRVERVLGECGIPKDSPAGRRQYQRLLEERRRAGEPAEHRALRRGWYLGDEVFRKELLGLMTAKGGGEHYGQEIREREVERAERVVAEELKRLKWKDTDLERVPKCAPEKVQMAARLRRESAMTLRWIASRLRMGAPSTLNNRLYWRRRGKV